MTDSKDYYLWHDENGEEHCRRLFNVTEWIIPGSDGNLQEDIKKALYHGFANHPPVTEVDYEQEAEELVQTFAGFAQYYKSQSQFVTDGEYIYEGKFNHSMSDLDIKRFPVEKRMDTWGFYRYAQEKQIQYENTHDVDKLTFEPIHTDWTWLYSFRDSEPMGYVFREDRINKTITLGLLDENKNVIASIGLMFEKSGEEKIDPFLQRVNANFYIEGEHCPTRSGSPLNHKLSEALAIYVEHNRNELNQSYLKEHEERERNLPVSGFPGLFELYEFELKDGERVTTPLINLDETDLAPCEAVKNVLLKEILPQWSYLRQINDDIDPFKYQRLAERLNKTVAITDGETVYLVRLNMENLNSPGMQLDPMGWIEKAVEDPVLITGVEIKKVTKLNKMLPFDSDWAEELANGHYLSGQKRHSR